MIKKQLIKAMIILSILVVGMVIGSSLKADTNKITPQPKPLHIKVQEWATKEWNDIKDYQAKGWADGKAQLTQNKEYIISLFNKLTSNN